MGQLCGKSDRAISEAMYKQITRNFRIDLQFDEFGCNFKLGTSK